VSNISYPFYVGHVLPGYMLMYFMISQGINVFWGIGLALIYAFIMAEIVHKQVEKKFLTLFKQSKPTSTQQAS
jgi:peptidoglycan/LPS O-acetylase OafA/YrhL